MTGEAIHKFLKAKMSARFTWILPCSGKSHYFPFSSVPMLYAAILFQSTRVRVTGRARRRALKVVWLIVL